MQFIIKKIEKPTSQSDSSEVIPSSPIPSSILPKSISKMTDFADAMRQLQKNKEQSTMPEAETKSTNLLIPPSTTDFVIPKLAPLYKFKSPTVENLNGPSPSGKAADFGSVIVGSSPTGPATSEKKKSFAELLAEAKEKKSKERTAEQIYGDAKGMLKVLGKKDAEFAKQNTTPFELPRKQLSELENRVEAENKKEKISEEETPQFISLPDTLPSRKDDAAPDDSQAKAILELSSEYYGCLIGAAGTGKTFTLKKLLKKIEEDIPSYYIEDPQTNTKYLALSIRFLAFTGRAVQQMKRQLPRELHKYCGTIHGELGLRYMPVYEEYFDEKENRVKTKMRFEPTYHRGNKMPAMYYFFDETGMLACDLWNKLMDAMPSGARVFFVGDINQLPPVYGRSVLGFGMQKWPTFELTTVHRQALDNPIIANAHKILQGVAPQNYPGQFRLVSTLELAKSLKIKDHPDGSTAAQQGFLAMIKKMYVEKLFDPFRDAIITAYNDGNCGQNTLNTILAPYFNPPDKSTGQGVRIAIQTGIARVNYALGDKVMLHANDKQTGLTNGQTGKIVGINVNGMYKNTGETVTLAQLEKHKNVEIDDIDFGANHGKDQEAEEAEQSKEESEASASQRQSSHIVTVDFDGKEVSFSTAGQFRKLSLAYVITCHKSQGGEYPTVIILAHSSQHKLLSREWLYTAVTRAQERVCIIYNSRGLMQALNTQRIKGRTLAEKIQSFQESTKVLPGMEDNQIRPNLPDRKKFSPEYYPAIDVGDQRR